MRFRNARPGLTIALAMVCGSILASQQPEPSGSPPTTWALRGKIVFEGTPPTAMPINLSGNPYCAQFPQSSNEFQVSEKGLENVMVYVSSAVPGPFPQIATDITLYQVQCRFVPRVLTLQVGQKLTIVNGDFTAHNVHAWASVNQPFNMSMTGGTQLERVFDKPEKAIPIKSDIHRWMSAFAGVFAHPYHTVSKAGGAYELKLPAGKHVITAWHERLGEVQQSIEVGASDNQRLDFVFKQP